jgi:hypothetical protein
MRTAWLRPLVAICAFVACREEDDPAPDAGAVDAGVEEAAPIDTDVGAGAGAPRDPTGPPAPAAITLVTGDRVIVVGDTYTIEPAAGREHVAFQSYRSGGSYHVIPSDAAGLVASGALDPRLFDITGLLDLKYDDDHRGDLPLIVTYPTGIASASVPASLAAGGVRRAFDLASIRGSAVRAPKSSAGAFWSALVPAAGRSVAVRQAGLTGGVAKIWLDGKRQLVLDESAAQIGAPAAWQAGFTGRGVTVAILDTGIQTDHPDFAGRIAATWSFLEDSPEVDDWIGHGTHVASIAAGSGAASGGSFRGIAPEAELLIGKVCDDFGCPESAILAGMEWAAQGGATVVNLSLGSPDLAGIDLLEEAINALTAEHGTLFVAAAGNAEFEDTCGVDSPGTADAAISVGAVHRDDRVADFSCRGPRPGDSAIKPDITAPGVGIGAARAIGSWLGDIEPIDDFYARLSGTSMATPHVAGAAAVLAQQHPGWQAEQLKAALIASARPSAEEGVFEQGAGRVDVAAAIRQTVLASPSTMNLAGERWPHDDDLPIHRTVVLRNSGSAPTSLRFTFDVRDPAGAPAPVGMFAVAPGQVTVPAGGDVAVTVTVSGAASTSTGVFAGSLVGTPIGAGPTVRMPLSLLLEVESYDLRLTAVDRAGNPALAHIFLWNPEHELSTVQFDGSSVLRLPRGAYHLQAFQEGLTSDQKTYYVLQAQPIVNVDRDQTIALDARRARPLRITVPHASARRALETVETIFDKDAGVESVVVTMLTRQSPVFDAIYTAQLGPSGPVPRFSSVFQSMWAEPGPSGDFVDSPYLYSLAFAELGRLPDGLQRAIRAKDLTELDSGFKSHSPGLFGSTFYVGRTVADVGSRAIFIATIPFRLPARRVDYFLTSDFNWAVQVWETQLRDSQPDLPFTEHHMQTIAAGPPRRLTTEWNAAVFGPNLAATFPSEIVRVGDELIFSGPNLFSDQAGHSVFDYQSNVEPRLYRDGVLVEGSDGSYPVPPGAASYRYEVTSARREPMQLSTEVLFAWNFRSERPATDEPVPLPVMTVRFLPRLDDHNQAPAGVVFPIPLSLSRQPGTPTLPLRRLSVDVSFDRGASWRPTMVLRHGDTGIALAPHPTGDGMASLRATAVDRDGNAVEETILDAYRLRR